MTSESLEPYLGNRRVIRVLVAGLGRQLPHFHGKARGLLDQRFRDCVWESHCLVVVESEGVDFSGKEQLNSARLYRRFVHFSASFGARQPFPTRYFDEAPASMGILGRITVVDQGIEIPIVWNINLLADLERVPPLPAGRTMLALSGFKSFHFFSSPPGAAVFARLAGEV